MIRCSRDIFFVNIAVFVNPDSLPPDVCSRCVVAFKYGGRYFRRYLLIILVMLMVASIPIPPVPAGLRNIRDGVLPDLMQTPYLRAIPSEKDRPDVFISEMLDGLLCNTLKFLSI